MRLILYSWQANNEQILADNLIKIGFEVVWFQKECKHYTRDMELAMEMIQIVHREAAEAVVSFNYFPIVSMICQTSGIPYYAWVYDCPHFTLYAKQVGDSCNHIGIFDRRMVSQLESYGVRTAYHVPLAVDCAYFADIIAHASRVKREKYQCDVSFVGSLYTDEHNYYDLLLTESNDTEQTDRANQYGKTYRLEQNHGGSLAEADGIIEEVIRRQCFSYENDYLRQAVVSGQINLARLQKTMEEQGLMLGADYFASQEDILLAAVLEKKVTVEERRKLLTKIALEAGKPAGFAENGTGDGGRNQGGIFDFRLYTGSSTKKLVELNAHNHGTVDYHTQMPLVFAGSRINLNISLRSIHSGIPLRVLDIMACGGFVLSNRQPEITECFEEGVEIVTFRSMDECIDKVHYYLSHEEERRQIAAAGQRKVKNEFSYGTGLARLFEV